MAIINQDIKFWSGDDFAIPITVLGPDNQPMDLTGTTIRWGLASAYDPRFRLLMKSSEFPAEIEMTDIPGGLCKVLLLAADTLMFGGEPYTHEAEIIDAAGSTVTIMTGSVTVNKAIIY